MTFWLFVVMCLSVQIGSRAVEGIHFGTGEIIALWVMFIGWLRVVAGGGRTIRAWGNRTWKVNRWLVLYAAWVCTASIANATIWGRAGALRSLREILPAMTLYVVMTLDKPTERVRRLFEYGALVVIVGSAVAATLQYSWGSGYLNPVNPDAWFKHRLDGFSLVRHPVVGFMGHPNGLGLVLAPCLSIASGGLAARLRRGILDAEMTTCAAVVLAGALALWLSQAKMAMFVAFVATAAAFIGTWSGRSFSPRLGAATLAATCISGAIGVWVATRALSAAGGLELGTLWYRLLLARESLDAVGHSVAAALIGGGLDVYRRVHPTDLTVHNEILNQLLKYGAIGTFLFAMAFGRAIQTARSRDWSGGIALISLAGILLVESANGVQALSLVYGLLAFAAVGAGIERDPMPNAAPTAVTLGTA